LRKNGDAPTLREMLLFPKGGSAYSQALWSIGISTMDGTQPPRLMTSSSEGGEPIGATCAMPRLRIL